MADRAAIWKKKADLLQRFLELTSRISEMLEGEDAGERLPEIERLIDERGTLIGEANRLELPPGAPDAKVAVEEEKQRWLCGELLGQIQTVEKKNVETMNRILSGYRESMRSNKQSSDAIGAYGRQMQGTGAQEGTLFNKTK